jgi:hypothetical protein
LSAASASRITARSQSTQGVAMFRRNMSRLGPGRMPDFLRPLRIFPGDHVQAREYRVNHFTSEEAAASIKESGQLRPGAGNLGVGVYVTTMGPETGHSLEEVKLAVRNPKLPDDRVSHIVTFDTDDLDQQGIKYEKRGTTVVIKTDKPLDIKSLNAKVRRNSQVEGND